MKARVVKTFESVGRINLRRVDLSMYAAECMAPGESVGLDILLTREQIAALHERAGQLLKEEAA